MKVISIRPPWAQHILFGTKRIENRTWTTSYRGKLMIHVGKSMDLSAPPFSDGHRERGMLLGTVELIAILSRDDALRLFPEQTQWIVGPWCWIFCNPQPLAQPIPVRGRLNLWKIEISFT